MSLFRGSLTYVRFFVKGDLPDDFREGFMRKIRLRAMKPLAADDEDLERSGWSKAGDPHALDLSYDDVFANEFLNLGFRTDRWVLPGPAVKTRLREAESAYLQKKGRERITRRERAELKELVVRRMRREMSPRVSLVDMSWSIGEGVVRFFAHAPKPGAKMSELFHKTFAGLTLVPEAPYTLAERVGLTKAEGDAWDDLEITLLGEGDDEDGWVDS